MRFFGLNNSILSNTTVYFIPYAESNSHISVEEAAMFAAGQRLGNLCAIIDFNRWQATGRSCEVMCLEPLAGKWRAFGWSVVEVDGHDVAALADAMSGLPDPSGKPLAIVAHTVKGKGVSFMEDDNNWHYRAPNDDELARALAELAADSGEVGA